MPITDSLDPGWAAALTPVAGKLAALEAFLGTEPDYLPAESNVLRAFRAPLADVRVLIVGQDPYQTPGWPIGLSFAVERDVRPIPPSLRNIYKELQSDMNLPPASHGDLSSWADNGVMLLNRVLTVRPGTPGSHRRKGWEEITDHAISELVKRGGPLVVILWGKEARTLAPLLGATPMIESSHPSPYSAAIDFFGSRPFSRANELLVNQGAQPIDWNVK